MGEGTAKGNKAKSVKMYCYLCCMFMFIIYAIGFLEPSLFPDKGNVWEYLA